MCRNGEEASDTPSTPLKLSTKFVATSIKSKINSHHTMPSRRACHQILRNSQTNNGFHKFSKLQIDIVESYATIQTNVATDYNPDWRTTICAP